MDRNFNDYGFDIPEWLDEHEINFKKNSSKEYANSAFRYFISKQNRERYPFIVDLLNESSSEFKTQFLNLAEAKFLLEQKFSKQFLYALICIFTEFSERSLISLRDIYAIYGNPDHLSPKRIIKEKKSKNLIGKEVIEHGYRMEEVIQYTRFDVFVNRTVALCYLQKIDPMNFENAQEYLDYFDEKWNIIEFLYFFIVMEQIMKD